MTVRRSKVLGAVLLTVGMALAACGSSQSGNSAGSGSTAKSITIGFANGGVGFDFLDQQSRVLKALAAKQGWKVVELNNNSDGPTAVKNVDEFIRDKVDYVIEFQIDSTVNPVISAKLQAAHIPVITEAIPGPNEYFVSVSDHTAGLEAGVELGNYAKANWNCQPDLIFLVRSTPTGDASTLRVGGDKDGIKQVCPDIPDSTFAYAEANNDNDTAVAAARNLLVAHPTAQKILVGGLSDNAVLAAITAAEQLQRAGQLFAWGGDGSALKAGTDSRLGGSVQFFLEGGIIPAFQVVQKLAAGKDVHKGYTPEDPTLLGKTCSMTLAQGIALPAIADRATQEIAAFPGKSPADLFCPKS
jgi:ABC-type sugar transport system substrate-binding protein